MQHATGCVGLQRASASDYSKGFGGKYGVHTDWVVKSAVGLDHKESLQQHASQKGFLFIF